MNLILDQGIMNYFNLFIKGVMTVGILFLIPLILLAGLRFISAKGSESALNEAKNYALKIFLATVFVVSLAMIVKIVLSFIFKLTSIL